MPTDPVATAASIPYEGTDCTAEEAAEAVRAVRASAATVEVEWCDEANGAYIVVCSAHGVVDHAPTEAEAEGQASAHRLADQPASAARSACGNGSMDDDDHAFACIACNLARWNEHRRDQRLRRTPKPRLRRLWNRVMRYVVLGDPTFLPNHEGERFGHVQ